MSMKKNDKIIKIPKDKLKEGMITAEPIFNSKGTILIPSNYIIDDLEKVKDFLDQHYTPYIYIKLPDDEDYEDEFIDEKYIEELNEYREKTKKTAQNIKENYKKILDGFSVKGLDIEENIKKAIKSIEDAPSNAFQMIESTKELDDMIYNHCHNVTLISYYIGSWLGLSDEELSELTLTAALHDIGKLKLSHELTGLKDFSDEDIVEFKKHAIYSHVIVKEDSYISQQIKRAILLHHENVDGSGKPYGLKGDSIPLYSKIIAVADTYNDLTSQRPYNHKKNPLETLKILEMDYINKLDIKILYIFLKKVGNYFIGQYVGLNNGKRAKIVFVPKNYPWRPMVQLELTEEVIDLSAEENSSLYIEVFY